MIAKRLGWFLLFTALFAISYSQAPLYFSNQHQYFVHGLAQAGEGFLSEDWLAQTKDPTPIFSALVAWTARFLSESLFYVHYALLMGVYFVSLMDISSFLMKDRATISRRVLLAGLLMLLHSACLRAISTRLVDVDYPWYFQAGVAGQYVLGPILQPSAFGVFLILSICLFVRDKPYWAVGCSSLGAVIHTTYLLPAAMLTLAYLFVLFREKRARDALISGGLALVVVLPIVIYNWLMFRPTSSEMFQASQEILVRFRIPHHAIPRLWLDGIAWGQIAWLMLGILLTWGTRLFWVLLIPTLLGGLLTIVQVVSGIDMLALLFPWRVSVILIPVATAVILTRLCLLIPSTKPRALLITGVSLVAVSVIGGILISALKIAFVASDAELGLLNHIRDNKKSGETYLIPVRVNRNLIDTVSGSEKSDFKPLKERTDPKFIPLDLQRFRLYARAPLFVDFKSIPYQDQDVLEWYQRLDVMEKIYEDVKAGDADAVVQAMRDHNLTHIVTTGHEKLKHPELILWHEDEYYRLYERSGR